MSGTTPPARHNNVFAGTVYERLRVFLKQRQHIDTLNDETVYVRPLFS